MYFIFCYDQPFSRYKVTESKKFTKWHQNDLELLTVKTAMCTLNTYLRGPIFCPFFSTTRCFQGTKCTRSWRIGTFGNAQNDLTDLKHLTIKNTLYMYYFVRFALRPSVFKIQGCWKSEISEMHRMTLLWNLNSQKYLIYTKYPQSPNVCPFYSMTSSFRDTRLLKNRNLGNVQHGFWLILKC